MYHNSIDITTFDGYILRTETPHHFASLVPLFFKNLCDLP